MEILRLPFFGELERAERVLVAGAGGGFDVFCGLPLTFALRGAGREVTLANLSFTRLDEQSGQWLSPALVEVTADSEAWGSYFPELQLARWFRERGEEVPVYAFPKTGVRPLAEAYRRLVEERGIDTVLLVDGGTDSLMRGDEAGLGTPEEDIASLAAVRGLAVPRKILVCLGFGIDHFHGVCHAQFLEAVAELARADAFLGAWSLTAQMPEVHLYHAATRAAIAGMPDRPSIVSTSILAAIAGQFGNFHPTARTEGSTLFINPLMSFYWAFHLEAAAARLLYPDELYETETMEQITVLLHRFRATHPAREWEEIPL